MAPGALEFVSGLIAQNDVLMAAVYLRDPQNSSLPVRSYGCDVVLPPQGLLMASHKDESRDGCVIPVFFLSLFGLALMGPFLHYHPLCINVCRNFSSPVIFFSFLVFVIHCLFILHLSFYHLLSPFF